MLKEMDQIPEEELEKMFENARSSPAGVDFGNFDIVTRKDVVKALQKPVNVAILTAMLSSPVFAACERKNPAGVNPAEANETAIKTSQKPIIATEYIRGVINQKYVDQDWNNWDKIVGGRVNSVLDFNVTKEDGKLDFTLLFSDVDAEEAYVFFDNKNEVSPYRSFLKSDESGNFAGFAVKNQDGSLQPFFAFVLKEFPDLSNLSEAQLETVFTRSLAPENIEAVVFVDPVTKEQIIFSSDDPDFIDIGTDTPTPGSGPWNRFLADLQVGLNFNLTAKAEGLPTSTPTSRPTETEIPTEVPVPTETPAPTETSVPTKMHTPLPTLTRTPTNESTVTPFPTYTPSTTEIPTVVEVQPDGRERLPINPQDYTLSCELASAEITTLWYNQARADGAIAIPVGYKTFEDFFIAEAGLADNPVEGYCGYINGRLSTNCDASSGLGYGVYNEPLLNGYRKLGIPAEAVTIKDVVAGKEQLRQTLIDSYNNDQVLALWGRWDDGTHPIEWRTNPRTGEQYPMAYGEHCVAGQVISVDGNNIMIEISDPFPYGKGTRRVYTFNTLYNWMSQIGWIMVIRVG